MVKIKLLPLKDNSYTLLDKDGNEVSTTPAYAADGTTVIGNFTIGPSNWSSGLHTD